MKMVDVNTVFMREEAKQARDTHRYTLLPATPSSQQHRVNYRRPQKFIRSCDYDVMKKASTYVEQKASHFLKNQPAIKKK